MPGSLPEKAEPYRISFSIGGPGEGGLELLECVETRVREWLVHRSQAPQFDSEVVEGTWSDDDYEISIERGSLGDVGYASFKWECQDRRSPDFWLRLDVDLATNGGPVEASIESYFLEREDADPPDMLAGPPPIVHELLDAFDCYLGEERLANGVTRVSTDEVPAFAAGRILSPERRLPIIAVSQDGRGNTSVDLERLQRVLAGVAAVATYGSAAVGLRDQLGWQLACYNGALRVYWPGCATQDASNSHRVWMGREATRLGFLGLARQIQGECLRRLAPAFSRDLFESVRSGVEWEKMLQRIAELERQSTAMPQERESGAVDGVAELEATVSELKRQLRNRTDETNDLRRAIADSANAQQSTAAAGQIEQMQRRIDEQEGQVDELETEVQHWRNQYDASLRRYDREANYWNGLLTANDWVGRGLWELRAGLAPYVERCFTAKYPGRVTNELEVVFRNRDGTVSLDWQEIERDAGRLGVSSFQVMDVAALLRVMDHCWNEVFRGASDYVGPSERDRVKELRRCRNDWAHQKRFSAEGAARSLDTMHRLLSAIDATQSGAVENLKHRYHQSNPQSSRHRAA